MNKNVLLVALGLALSPLAAAADSTCSALVITGHPAYPPVAWAQDGRIVGSAPELVAKVAQSLGVKQVTSKDFGSWEKAQAAARSGEADIIFGIYRNDERKAYLEYVEPPFMLDPVAIAVRQGGEFPFAKWQDLKGRKGVTNAGESFGNEFDAFMAKELTVARANGVDQAFAALVDGKADYMIVALYPGRELAQKYGVAAKVAFLPREVRSFEMYVAFSKKSKCVDALKAGFAAGIKASVEPGKAKGQ